ncbi:MAG: patatin-like phospholipase family protein [Pseudomonadota bacterium]
MLQGLGFLFGGERTNGEKTPPDGPEPRKLKIGLALGGGAARGWAHIGILKRLDAAGIVPDIVAGTSIGALAGGCYVAGKLGELEAFTRTLTKRRIFSLLDVSLRGSGLIGGRKLIELLDTDLMYDRIENLPRKFIAVATELKTGHEVWLSKGSMVDALRASYALPGIFEPVQLGGRWLIDGALVNPCPVSVCRAYGADLVIAVVLHADNFGRSGLIADHGGFGNESAKDSQRQNDPAPSSAKADRMARRKILGERGGAPGLSSVMIESFNIMQDRIARARLAGDPPDVLISPKLGIGLFEFHRAAEAIAIGWETVDKVLPEIKAAQDALA